MNKGKVLITVTLGITIVLWLVSKFLFPQRYDVFLYISQISALCAITLISINYVLAGKFRVIEDWFGGLDRVFNNHHNIGKYAFILILIHPTLMILKVLPNMALVKLYILPSILPSYTAGVLAFYLFFILLLFSLVIKLPFRWWRNLHDFMWVPLIPLSFHIILINSDVSRFLLLKVWIMTLVTFALYSIIHIKFFQEKRKLEYTLKDVEDFGGIVRIHLLPKSEKLKFNAGQFAFLKFPNVSKLNQYHPFTISSKENSEVLVMNIKKGGDFTNTLEKLNEGEIANVLGPYGRFNLPLDLKNSLWIAGGIGITPFLSASKNDSMILHQIKNRQDDIFSKEISGNYLRFQSFEDERIDIEAIEELVSKRKIKNIVLCGPSGFVKGLIAKINKSKELNVNVYYELFELYSS